jgi:hypothetical protein
MQEKEAGMAAIFQPLSPAVRANTVETESDDAGGRRRKRRKKGRRKGGDRT